MFRFLTVLACSVVIGAVAAGSPASATVIADPVRSPVWVPASCATGTLTGAVREPGGGVVVSGTAEACGDHVAKSFFALAVFHIGTDLKPFAEHDDARFYRKEQPRPFAAHAFRSGTTDAVCLMASSTKRLSCAWVSAPHGQPVTMTPIGIDDPVVRAPVELGRRDPGNPGDVDKCATCF